MIAAQVISVGGFDDGDLGGASAAAGTALAWLPLAAVDLPAGVVAAEVLADRWSRIRPMTPAATRRAMNP
ncbi:hypothetical protein [Streptomyces sp. NPDC088785]|uniref:hypothetical protein n=1 Tax=Streptomyces sp. NPDC088785 TaxID=3365897 RepID=UPI003815B188